MWDVLCQVADPTGPFQEGSGFPISSVRGMFLLMVALGGGVWGVWIATGLLEQFLEEGATSSRVWRDLITLFILLGVISVVIYNGR